MENSACYSEGIGERVQGIGNSEEVPWKNDRRSPQNR